MQKTFEKTFSSLPALEKHIKFDHVPDDLNYLAKSVTLYSKLIQTLMITFQAINKIKLKIVLVCVKKVMMNAILMITISILILATIVD